MHTSTLGKERIVTIDILRGIAILGIFLVNIPAMTGLDKELIHMYTGGDKTIRFLLDIFVQTKFYTIFSFLFGLGFYLFIDRAKARGTLYFQLFIRRLLILFLFGTLHFIFLWDGDILHTYAFIGFLLLAFYHRKQLTIFVWSIILFGIFHLFLSLTLFIPYEYVAEQLEQTTRANYFDYFFTSISERGLSFFTDNLFAQAMLLPEIFSMFLLGLLAGKINLFNKISTYRRRIIHVQIVSFCLFILFAIPITISFFTNEAYITLKNLFWITIGGKALAVFYVSSISLLMETNLGQKILQPFKYVGQMALTNYLLQTIIGVVILSIFIKDTSLLPLWSLIPFVFLIYSLQIVFSKWWLASFHFGPVEWVWRMLTYKKILPLKKLSL